MNRSKKKGTEAETAVVRFLKEHGFPKAKRVALAGSEDEGDVDFCPGAYFMVVEVKGGKAAETASMGQVEKWLLETARERDNGAYEGAVLVVKRAGYGAERVHAWTAHMFLHDLLTLIYGDARIPSVWTPISMPFGSFVALVKDLGYGK